MAQRERAAQTRANEEVSQARMNVAARIVSLQQQVASGADPAALTQALSGVLRSLAPTGEPEAEHPAAETPAPAPSGTTVSLPNVAIVAAPAQAEPQPVAAATAAAVEQPSAVAEAAQASSAPPGYSGGESDDEPWAASPAPAPAVEDNGTQTGAQG
jgi:hypothetical protein